VDLSSTMGLGQDLLQHERVHVDGTVLEKMERQHADLVVLAPVTGHLVAPGEIDEIVSTVPLLDGVEAFVDLTAQRIYSVAGHRSGPLLSCPIRDSPFVADLRWCRGRVDNAAAEVAALNDQGSRAKLGS